MVRVTLGTLLLSVILLSAVVLSVITVGVNMLGVEMVIVAMQSVIHYADCRSAIMRGKSENFNCTFSLLPIFT